MGQELAFLSTTLIRRAVAGGRGGGGGGADTGAVLALAAAMEAWCAAAHALERAIAAAPRWRRRRCPAPGWPGAGEEKVEALAVCRSGGAPGQAAVDGPSWMSMLAFNSPPSVEVVRVACPPALHTRQKVSKMRQSSPWLV